MQDKAEGQDISGGEPRADDPLQQQLEWAHRRVRGLLDEARSLRAEQGRLRDRTQQLEAERLSLMGLLVRAERLVRTMESGIHAMRRSVSMQLGYLVTRSLRSFDGIVKFPYRFFALVRESTRVGRNVPGGAKQIVPVPVPQEWFPTALRRQLGKLQADMAQTLGGKASSGSGSGNTGPTPRFGHLPERLADLRVAAIMDEFTFSAYRDCCEVLQITPDGWSKEIPEFRPHLLFIESAWDGKDRAWQRKVSGASQELRELIRCCQSKGIPVVFWSKEDPVHFKTFLGTAKLADVVFTTDIDCVSHYKTELGHDRVYALPFATQPLSHHPVERYERKHTFCFAGSYYTRYPVRQRDFASLIEAANAMGGVDIYDRNFGKDHPNFIFPDAYHPHILGGLSFDQIDLAYKGYDFGININTVKNSQSMFARRVFDLLSSNTTVVSNYSRGMRLMFGDLVVSSDDVGQLIQRLQLLASDPSYRRKHRLAGLRKVLQEHTYQHRLAYVVEKAFGRNLEAGDPSITVLALAGSDDELGAILVAYRRQQWVRKQLVICFADGYMPVDSPVGDGVRVLSAAQATSRSITQVADGSHIAAFHHEDYYGPHYLTDLALAVSYSRGSAVGKVAYFGQTPSGPALHADGMQYREHVAIAYRRALVPIAELSDEPVYSWLSRSGEASHTGGVLSIDEFNYCANGAGFDHCIEADDLDGLDVGISLATLLDSAEHAGDGVALDGHGRRDESVGLAGLEGQAMYESLAVIPSAHLSAELSDGNLVFHSTLPQGKHAYVYLADELAPKQMRFSDIGRLQLVCDRGDALDLVLVFKDEGGDKISHAILRAGTNVTVAVPGNACSVQIGFRIHAAGDIAIRRLVFEHVPLAIEAFVTRGRHLLLAKNYPSYDDLYKHAFVHRRVVEYRRHGMSVDVFRIGNSGLTYYEYDGVDVAYGQTDHLRAMLKSGNYESIMVHFLDERMWEVLQEFVDSTKIFVWAHGAEIQSASRREFDHVDTETRRRAVALGDRRMAFWKQIFSEHHPNLKMVFVSDWFANDVFDDVGVSLPKRSYEVIHNFIDTELFSYREKNPEQRLRILSIRPYESAKYANDLAVAAVLALKDKPFFCQLEFRFVGDGRLFDEVMAPLADLPNVMIEKRFLPQPEIAALHREYGVFLNPTRMDAQGVSRDEAMSSGLVPISTRITAIPEFVDENCGFLAAPEDAAGLADAIEALYLDPVLFSRMSRNAAERVRMQSGFNASIAREISLVAGRTALGG